MCVGARRAWRAWGRGQLHARRSRADGLDIFAHNCKVLVVRENRTLVGQELRPRFLKNASSAAALAVSKSPSIAPTQPGASLLVKRRCHWHNLVRILALCSRATNYFCLHLCLTIIVRVVDMRVLVLTTGLPGTLGLSATPHRARPCPLPGPQHLVGKLHNTSDFFSRCGCRRGSKKYSAASSAEVNSD